MHVNMGVLGARASIVVDLREQLTADYILLLLVVSKEMFWFIS